MIGVNEESEEEIFFGYTIDRRYRIILRPVRGPLPDLRERTPPPPPRTPSPPPPPPRPPTPLRPRAGPMFIPVSDGSYAAAGDGMVKRECLESPPAIRRVPPASPPPPRWMTPHRGPWNSPEPQSAGGLIINEVAEPQPPYGEVMLTADPNGARVTARPVLPMDEGFSEELSPKRPRSASPFVRSVKPKVDPDEVGDMAEAISCLLDFSKRTDLARRQRQQQRQQQQLQQRWPARSPSPEHPFLAFGPSEHREEMVQKFLCSTPKRAPRQPSPVRISDRILTREVIRPVPTRRSLPSAALGAPLALQEEEEELPDLPEAPRTPSPVVSDVTALSSLSTYESEEEEEEDEEFMTEYEYADPNSDEEPWSSTPPPSCDGTNSHMMCVPPVWGEKIQGAPLKVRCLLCHEDDRHHGVRCVQCHNAPACCDCIWTYMRSRYNSGCPLCRHGDPCEDNPLGSRIQRRLPRRVRGGNGMLVGIGRSRGRARPTQQAEEQPRRVLRRPRGRGRAVTLERN